MQKAYISNFALTGMNKKSVFVTVVIVLAVAVLIYFISGGGGLGIFVPSGGGQSFEVPEEMPFWMTEELEDVNTGESFVIADIDKPVLLESFATWCPVCQKQQENVKKLHEEIGDEVVSVAINTDPNEDAEDVKEYARSNGFDWNYVVASPEVVQSLIENFGSGIVNAPSVPMILICEDKSYRKLGGFGARSVDKLKSEIEAGC